MRTAGHATPDRCAGRGDGMLRLHAEEVPMIGGLAVLLLFQLAGEVLTRIGDLPVPGPVVGMVLLTGVLGVVIGPALLRRLKVDDPASAGFALGVASHGWGWGSTPS